MEKQKEIEMKDRDRTNRPLVLASVMIAMFMTAVESTIVGTAMPSIVSDLGGFSMLTWVFSTYLLAQAVTVPIYGKMADLFGRKSIFLIGATLFLVGSFLSGLSGSMLELILFRILQGLGAGAIQPIVTTIVGDIYSVEERAKVQGYLSSVWGISAIVGPMLGALFVQIHWAFIFWINIPLGLFAIFGITKYLHENFVKKPHQIDYLGSFYLFMTIFSLMLFLLEGGSLWPWISWQSGTLLLLSLIGFLFFILQERKAKEPMMPLHIWGNPTIAFGNLASLTTGGILIGISSFLPTHIQGVMGYTPLVAGFALTAMSIGWPLASSFSGRIILKRGYRTTSLLGGVFLIIGSAFFLTLSAVNSPVWAGVASFFVGVGMGFSSTSFIVSIQNAVPWNVRGVATSTNLFMRTLGGTVGAAFLGSLLNSALASHLSLSGLLPEQASSLMKEINLILDPVKRAQMNPADLSLLIEGLKSGLEWVYWGLLALALISLLLILFLPKEGVKKEV